MPSAGVRPIDGPLLALSLFAVGTFTGIAVAHTAVAAGVLALAASAWLPGARIAPRVRPGARLGGLLPVLCLYFGIQILSILYSQHVSRSLACLRGDLPLLMLALFSLLFARTRRPLAPLAIFVAAAAVSGLYGLWQFFAGRDLYHDRSLDPLGSGHFIAVGNLGGHLTYGGVQLVAALVSFALAAHAPRRGARAWAAVAAFASSAGLLASGARSAWVGFLAGALLLLWSLGRRRFLGGSALLVVAALLVLAIPGMNERARGFLELDQLPRIRLWRTALRIWADFPVTGAGLGAFKTHFPIYKVPGDYLSTIHPHNDLLNVAVHSGLAGLVAFGVLWVWLLRTLRAGLAARRAHAGLVWGAAAATVGFLVAGLGQCYFTDEEPVAALWFIAGAAVAAVWSQTHPPDVEDPREDILDGDAVEALPPPDEGRSPESAGPAAPGRRNPRGA